MDSKRRTGSMFVPTVVMGVLAIGLLLIGYYKGDGQHVAGLKSALSGVGGSWRLG